MVEILLLFPGAAAAETVALFAIQPRQNKIIIISITNFYGSGGEDFSFIFPWPEVVRFLGRPILQVLFSGGLEFNWFAIFFGWGHAASSSSSLASLLLCYVINLCRATNQPTMEAYYKSAVAQSYKLSLRLCRCVFCCTTLWWAIRN